MTGCPDVDVEGARELLAALGFMPKQSNERSGRVLLALAGLTPEDDWSAATNEAWGVWGLIDHIGRHWEKTYAWGSRETIRRQTLHQFVDAGLVEYNHDDPTRPTNSDRNNYRLSPAALGLLRVWGTPQAETALADYLEQLPGQVAAYAAARDMERIPVTLPDGAAVTLSPGGQNVLLADIVHEFCPRFAPGGRVLFIGDADGGSPVHDADALADLGIELDMHGKLPDLVVHLSDRGWLFLMEAASSHGPVDAKRHAELTALFAGTDAGLVFVSCFPDRSVMRGYLADLAWETEAWCASDPDHLVHLDGVRFLGPY